MAYRSKRGLGRTQAEDIACKTTGPFAGTAFAGIFTPVCWTRLESSTVAPVGAPTGDVLTVPPVSGEQAQATIDALVNQQLVDQNALNAGAVQSSWWDTLTGAVYGVPAGAVSGASSIFPWVLGGVGLLAFAFVAVGGGSARRYGR